ncbi:MAG: hypothetical protein GY953_19065 [bacterium]|nr:hypothetical protein [bacterium]
MRAWIAQHPAVVVYSGPAPGLPGVWQINVYVPADLAVTGEVPLFVAAHDLASNGVTIWVE